MGTVVAILTSAPIKGWLTGEAGGVHPCVIETPMSGVGKVLAVICSGEKYALLL